MKAVIYGDAGGLWRWRISNARNGKIIAESGEGYHNKGNATRALRRFLDWLAQNEVEVVAA